MGCILRVSIVLALMFSFILMSQPLGNNLAPNSNFNAQSMAQSSPTGACFPNGPQVITTAMTWVNLQCDHFGNLVFENAGSLTMINSSLIQSGSSSSAPNVSSTGGVILTGTSKISLESSVLSFHNGSSVLQLSGNSNITLMSSQVNLANISAANNATIVISQNSQVSAYGLQMSNFTNLLLESSSFSCTQSCSSIRAFANRISFAESTFSAQGTMSTIYLSGLSTTIANSQVHVFNSSAMELGSTALNSTLTSVVGSIVNESGSTTDNLTIAGSTSLEIANSTVINQITTLANANATLALRGGSVSVLSSSVTSSSRGFYGYSTLTASALAVESTSNLVINQSRIVAGQLVGLYGVYSQSRIDLASQGNIEIGGSYLQTEASQSANFTIQTKTPATTLHYVTINQSTIETNNSPGSVSIFSNFALTLNRAKIDANSSKFDIGTYNLTAYNSNITTALTFGKSIGVGNLYNTTSFGISGTSYNNYGWLAIHVVPGSQSCSAGCTSDANVTLFDPTTGAAAYHATTNSTGYAEFPVLLNQSSSQKTHTSWTYYVAEAQKGDLWSKQFAVNASASSLVTLPLGIEDAPSNSTFTGCMSNSEELTVSCSTNSSNYVGYGIQYGYLKPTSYIGIVSNAFPLGIINNASASQFAFRTLGSGGHSFNVTILYATNFTSVTPTIRVDGLPVHSNIQSYNSTYDEDIFTVPSGLHGIVFSYSSPSGFFVYQVYPQFYPSIATIIIVILLAVVASTFLIYYVRSSDRGNGARFHVTN